VSSSYGYELIEGGHHPNLCRIVVMGPRVFVREGVLGEEGEIFERIFPSPVEADFFVWNKYRDTMRLYSAVYFCFMDEDDSPDLEDLFLAHWRASISDYWQARKRTHWVLFEGLKGLTKSNLGAVQTLAHIKEDVWTEDCERDLILATGAGDIANCPGNKWKVVVLGEVQGEASREEAEFMLALSQEHGLGAKDGVEGAHIIQAAHGLAGLDGLEGTK